MRPLLKMLNQDLRDLMHIPDNYKVLFPSGRRLYLQFRHGSYEPDEEPCGRLYHYRTVGKESTSKKHQIYGKANAIASSPRTRLSAIFRIALICLYPEDADYVYICENNTIYGTKF